MTGHMGSNALPAMVSILLFVSGLSVMLRFG